jgi:hypothetical protein
VKVIEGMELICGKIYNLEKASAAATICWTVDVIHPTNHTYAKMALLLLEAIAPQNPAAPAQASSSRGGGGGGNNRKRTHSDSESIPRNTSRQDRSRNWAEQRREQARAEQHYYPAPYPAPYPNPYQGPRDRDRDRNNFYGRYDGGGYDRYHNTGSGGGDDRPQRRGRGPRGKRRH